MNLLQRKDNDLLIRHIDLLREAVRWVRCTHPFTIHGWVVLPDHLHCVISLPPGDADFALRWRLIKMRFSKTVPDKEWRSETRQRRGERGIWQRRYWEHLIRNEKDFAAHMDYVHINPVKHGLVKRVIDWPHSTFHRLVEEALYPFNICLQHKVNGVAPFAYTNLGVSLHRQGQLEQAAASLKVARDMFKAQNQRPGEAYVVDCLAQMHAEDGHKEEAARAWRYALSHYDDISSPTFQTLRESGRHDILQKLDRLNVGDQATTSPSQLLA